MKRSSPLVEHYRLQITVRRTGTTSVLSMTEHLRRIRRVRAISHTLAGG
jgi:hypothetical protein